MSNQVEGEDEPPVEEVGAAPIVVDADVAAIVAPDEADRIRALFTRSAEAEDSPGAPDESGDAEDAAPAGSVGAFHFARWGRPISPRIFGIDEDGAAAMMAGIADAARKAGVEIVEEDPEFEANFLVFMCEAWGDLKQTPSLDRLIPDLDKLVAILGAAGANQYRIFSFSPEGGIRLAVVLLRYDEDLARFSARALGLGQATQTLLLWSDAAFLDDGPLTMNRRGEARLKPWFADLLSAAYDEATPDYSTDPALAEALAVGVATRRAAAKAAAEARSARRRNGAGKSNGAFVVAEATDDGVADADTPNDQPADAEQSQLDDAPIEPSEADATPNEEALPTSAQPDGASCGANADGSPASDDIASDAFTEDDPTRAPKS